MLRAFALRRLLGAAFDGPAYGDTLSWPLEHGPGLGERPVTVVQDIDLPRFERLTIDLLCRPRLR